MQRLSNRTHDENKRVTAQVQYIDRIVEVPVAAEQVHTHSERIVEIPVERIVEVEKIISTPAVDLEPIYNKIFELETKHLITVHSKNKFIEDASNELKMQSRALIALKTQRDIDRNRRLMLIRRIKKEQKAHKKTELKFKLAIGASLLLAIASLIMKL